MRSRTALSMGVIVALGIGVWAAINAGVDDPLPTTTSSTTTEVPASSTTAAAPTTSTRAASSTTTDTSAPGTTQTPDTREEEVRQILEDLYFRWFSAIYHNDEEAVLEVIATSNNLEDFKLAATALDLPSEPRPSDIQIRNVEVLRQDTSCLVVSSLLDMSSWRGEEAITEGVDVLLPVEGEWRFATSWERTTDLWHQDCEIEPDLR